MEVLGQARDHILVQVEIVECRHAGQPGWHGLDSVVGEIQILQAVQSLQLRREDFELILAELKVPERGQLCKGGGKNVWKFNV